MKFQNVYIDDHGNIWKDENLYAAAENEENTVTTIRVEDYINSPIRWQRDTAFDIANHVKRIVVAELTYPVILGPDKKIVSGYHRLIKAYLSKIKTLDAIILKEMPEPDFKP